MKRQGIVIGLVLLCLGCIYREPPPTVTDLMDLLPGAQSSLPDFSFDLNSRLLLPFLTGFGRDLLASNVVDETSNMVLLLPLVSGRPAAIAFQIVSDTERQMGIEVYLNEISIGTTRIESGTIRRKFVIERRDWDTMINSIRIAVTDGYGSLQVDNTWLLFDESEDLAGLEPGNRFTGFVMIPGTEEWEKSIFLPSETSIKFPVYLPDHSAFVHTSLLSDDLNVQMDLQLITARRFGHEPPLTTQVSFRSIDAWTPIRWDISERAGRHGVLEIINRGQSAVLLKDLYIQSESVTE